MVKNPFPYICSPQGGTLPQPSPANRSRPWFPIRFRPGSPLGSWQRWLRFFLIGMADSADNATQTVRLLYRQINADRQHLLAQQGATVTAIQLIQHLPEHPVITMPLVTRLLETSNLTAGKAIELLVAAGDLASQTVAHLKDYLNKDAAENWCKNATSYSLKHGGKPWIYRLISHDTISENMSVDHLGKG